MKRIFGKGLIFYSFCSCLWYYFCSIVCLQVCAEHSFSKQQLEQRLALLRTIAVSKPLKHTCSTDTFVKITEYAFGNSGNNLIEFTHGLWLSNLWNATLIIPPWMHHILRPFNQTVIKMSFCYVETLSSEPSKQIIEVTSEDSFFMFNLFANPAYSDNLPQLNAETLLDLSEHFLR